jgi:hypothetical protein
MQIYSRLPVALLQALSRGHPRTGRSAPQEATTHPPKSCGLVVRHGDGGHGDGWVGPCSASDRPAQRQLQQVPT